MTEIADWIAAAARRDRAVVRLEDALLTDRYARYFWFRLRYFAVRTLVAVVVHAIRVALLYAAFPSDQFAIIILLGAATALLNDSWWGALERLREGVRQLQRDGQPHRIPAHIGAWLRLALRLAIACGVGAAVWLAAALAAGWTGPIDLYGMVLIGGLGGSLVARTYHSGAYALRRVYRPLPSLVAVDIGGLMALLVLYPVIGIWAFPVGQLLSMVAVVGLSMHYTSRTYRALGLPRLRDLVANGRSLPPPRALRLAVAPALASTLSGLDSLLVLTVVVAAARPGEGPSLIALLAALGPVIRAGYEWASLLYFDLVRLGAPLLSRLRERFDHQVRRLALVMGGLTWLVAAGIGAIVLGIRDAALLVALLPFLVSRSLLASGQVRAFVAGGYRALIVVGGALVLVSVASESLRLVAVALTLLVAAGILMSVRGTPRGRDRVASLLDCIGLLRGVPGPVLLTRVRLDQAHRLRGITREDRDAEAWRQTTVARRLARRVGARGGGIAWVGPSVLAWFEPVGDGAPMDDIAIADAAAGLLVGRPERIEFPNGQDAARSLGLGSMHAGPLPSAVEMADRFRARFPTGLVLRPGPDVDDAGSGLTSRDRAAVLRAALRFARSLAQVPEPQAWDVSALVAQGALVVLFLVPRTASDPERRRWREEVREWDLRAAVEGPMLSVPRGPGRARRLSRSSWSRTMGYR
jgi:hypothetical protein